MQESEKPIYSFMITVLIMVAVAGAFLNEPPLDALKGFLLLQRIPTRLISDFTVLGGVGAALLNSAAVGALSLSLINRLKIRLSGPTLAAVFTLMGFSLFGTTPTNSVPVVCGVYLASRIAKTPFSHYLLIALFGSSIGPAANFLAYETGLTGSAALVAGMGVGVVVGVLLPAIAMAMLRLHEGFNLYNVGLTSGFIALFVASLLSASGHDVSTIKIWNTEPSVVLMAFTPTVSILAVAWGFAMEGKAAAIGFLGIQKLSGRLPSDFLEMKSPGAGLVNMGTLGLLASAYVFAVGGDFNGPVLGGLLTVFGFAGFGKHLRNSVPVVLGIIAAIFLFGKSPAAPGPLLATMFGTTLAPLAGEFGPFIGMLAGFLHLTVVERSAAWHGGLNLYNNGFAGGLVAILFVSILEWYRSKKKKK